jgi:RecB family exonuclease
VNHRKFPKLCPSRLRDLPCPKRFHTLQVLRQVPPQPWSHPLVYGIASHRLMRMLYNPGDPTPPPSRDVARLARAAFLEERYEDPTLQAADTLRAEQMARQYLPADADALNTFAVEVNGEVDVPGGKVRPFGLSAKFDRLIVRPESPRHLVIRDYKTGRPAAADLEAACIMLAVAKLRNKEYTELSLEFDYLGDAGLVVRQTVTFAEAKVKWPELSARALRIYEATEFPPEPGEHCMWCPLRPTCQPALTVDAEELHALFA